MEDSLAKLFYVALVLAFVGEFSQIHIFTTSKMKQIS